LSKHKFPQKEILEFFRVQRFKYVRVGRGVLFEQLTSYPWLKEKLFYNPKLKRICPATRNDSTKTEIFFL
jgi:hypothetical protein